MAGGWLWERQRGEGNLMYVPLYTSYNVQRFSLKIINSKEIKIFKITFRRGRCWIGIICSPLPVAPFPTFVLTFNIFLKRAFVSWKFRSQISSLEEVLPYLISHWPEALPVWHYSLLITSKVCLTWHCSISHLLRIC